MSVKHSGQEPIKAIIAGLYGKPKVGKSSFAASMPNVLVADVDGAAENCATMRQMGTAYMPVRNTDEMNAFLEEAEKPEYKSIVIDTLSHWTYIWISECIGGMGQSEYEHNKWAPYQKLTAHIQTFIHVLKGLNKHVLCTMHPGFEKDEGTGRLYGGIDLAGKKGENFVYRLLDDIWLLDAEVNTDSNGEEKVERFLYARPFDIYYAGSRLGLSSKLGPNPTWDTVAKQLNLGTMQSTNGKKRGKR